jgi:hypothetical protein
MMRLNDLQTLTVGPGFQAIEININLALTYICVCIARQLYYTQVLRRAPCIKVTY